MVHLYIPYKSAEAISKIDTEFSLNETIDLSDITNTFIFMDRVASAFECNMEANSDIRSFVITGETDKAEKLLKWFLHQDSKIMIEVDTC